MSINLKSEPICATLEGEVSTSPGTERLPLPKMIFRRIFVALSRSVARMRPRTWIFYDVLMAVIAWSFSYMMAPLASGKPPDLEDLVAFSVVVVLAGNIFGLYGREVLHGLGRLFVAVFSSAVVAVFVTAFFTHLVLYHRVGRWVFLFTFVLFLSVALLPRLLAWYAVRRHKNKVLFVGDDIATVTVIQRLRSVEEQHFVLAGFCNGTGTSINGHSGTIEDIPRLCRELGITDIVISEKYKHRAEVLDQCLFATQYGCRFLDESSFHEEIFEEVPVSEIANGWFYSAQMSAVDPLYLFLKRTLDIVLAIIALPVAIPVCLVVCALVRLTSAGPILYSQMRCGQYGTLFNIYKFRTMSVDAESNGACWAKERDPRVTAVGRFLRRTRLDEIPQIWNVLLGQMSLVGPRPERPELINEIEKEVPYFSVRHLVQPGITGLAQTQFRYGADVNDARKKLQYDLYYIKNRSLGFDLQIILRTIAVLMRGSR